MVYDFDDGIGLNHSQQIDLPQQAIKPPQLQRRGDPDGVI
jgi:hypothetical protein